MDVSSSDLTVFTYCHGLVCDGEDSIGLSEFRFLYLIIIPTVGKSLELLYCVLLGCFSDDIFDSSLSEHLINCCVVSPLSLYGDYLMSIPVCLTEVHHEGSPCLFVGFFVVSLFFNVIKHFNIGK